MLGLNRNIGQPFMVFPFNLLEFFIELIQLDPYSQKVSTKMIVVLLFHENEFYIINLFFCLFFLWEI